MQLDVEEVGSLADLLFQEAFGTAEGRLAVVNRLSEVMLVHFLRQALTQRQTEPGLLAGLAHPQLQSAVTAMHAEPARDWTLDDMAASAGLSRSGFSKLFKETIGITPGEHLVRFRVSMTQELLAQGIPLKTAAYEVGYGSSTALSRAFREQTGVSPREWLKGRHNIQPADHSKEPGGPFAIDMPQRLTLIRNAWMLAHRSTARLPRQILISQCLDLPKEGCVVPQTPGDYKAALEANEGQLGSLSRSIRVHPSIQCKTLETDKQAR